MSFKGNKQKRVLIMKGGGIKGLAYVGALEVLEDFYEFYWYTGTSAGAIAASLLASGHSTEELRKILGEQDFNNFKDANFLKKTWNLFFRGGLYEAFTFKQWLNNLLGDKLDTAKQVKLGHLPFRLTIYASKRWKSAIVFDSINRPDVPVSHAARSSMSIPFIFTPEKEYGLNVFDGGLQNNYPVDQVLSLAIDENPDFIGFYLGPERFEEEKASNNIFGIFKDLISIWTEAVDVENLERYEDNTVVIDPRPISTLQFKLNEDEKEFLLEAGRIAAIKFLRKKEVVNDAHQYLNDFNQRTVKLDEKRKKLKSINRGRKHRKRTKVLVCLLLLISGLFIWSNNSCIKSDFGSQPISKSLKSFWHCAIQKDIPVQGSGKVKLAIENAEAEEGNPLKFPILLEETYDSIIKLNFEIQYETASSDDISNIEDNLIVIPRGKKRDTITIETLSDKNYNEGSETFSVRLTNVVGENIHFTDSVGKGTILDMIKPISNPIPVQVPEKAFIKGKIIDEQGSGINQVDVSHEENSTKTNRTGFFFLSIPKKQCNKRLILIEIKKGNKMLTKSVRICREDLIIGLTN